MSSIKVFDGYIALFEDARFRGEVIYYKTGEMHNAVWSFNDKPSSWIAMPSDFNPQAEADKIIRAVGGR